MFRPLSSLSPKTERSLSVWQDIQYRSSLQKTPLAYPTITLTRAFGCEAFPLALRLQETLEAGSKTPWTIFDRTLIEKVSQDEGISLFLLRELGNPTSDLDALGLNSSHHLTHREAFEKVAQHMRTIAAEGNAILIDRGAAVICQGMKNCYHFRLDAGLAWRIASIVNRLGISEAEASALIRNNGRHREKFFSACLGADINDLQFYDAVFNNEHHSVDQMAVAIAGYLKQDWPDKSHFKAS
jgi:cytidylate kinase